MASCKFVDIHQEECATSTVHYIPFKIEHDGAARVQDLFTKTTKTLAETPEVLTNQFRGRPLNGAKLDMPANFEGIVATNRKPSTGLNVTEEDDDNEDDDGDNKTIHLINKFDSMTYWNWDKVPSSMDTPVKLMDWINLSSILHEPITTTSSLTKDLKSEKK